ncbi:MAG: hypothetical protein KUG78_19865 [Kangiellaceae bacterium]|nr:hypothetical protein [Kangiellaceae bacterium]
MDELKELYTNKTLVQILLQAPFRDLKIKYFPAYENQTLEQFSAVQTYYLMDTRVEQGWQPTIVESSLKEISNKIFCQELMRCDIPVDAWPDTTDFELFSKFMKAEFLILSADFGDARLINIECNI